MCSSITNEKFSIMHGRRSLIYFNALETVMNYQWFSYDIKNETERKTLFTFMYMWKGLIISHWQNCTLDNKHLAWARGMHLAIAFRGSDFRYNDNDTK